MKQLVNPDGKFGKTGKLAQEAFTILKVSWLPKNAVKIHKSSEVCDIFITSRFTITNPEMKSIIVLLVCVAYANGELTFFVVNKQMSACSTVCQNESNYVMS